jgi:hypothetical protein
VPSSVIIIAFEIANLIVVFSERYQPHYTVLDDSEKTMAARIKGYLTNMRPCFFLRFTRKATRKFFKDLKFLDNVRLVLYTSLPREHCEKILEDTSLDSFFEEKDRIYTRNELKSVAEVDHDTGRVIMVSANPKDQDTSLTSYHSLILGLGEPGVLQDEAILYNLRDCLVELALRGRCDTLHEDMHELTNQKGLPLIDESL